MSGSPSFPDGGAQAHEMADAVARRSYGKLVALLASRSGDLAAAEDALSEAFVSALVHWPQSGCPENPEAWLFSAARRKLIDFSRRQKTREVELPELQRRAESFESMTDAEAIPDHRLALMFACAHPAMDPSIRAPLILQTILGLDAATIGSAFLVSPATMSQRLVRAKSKIKEAGIPFRIPDREELPARLDAVLDAIYATFAEGWTEATGTDVARRGLAEEALFLGALLVELLPREPEALGLLGLMLHAEARRRSRRNCQGEFVPFAEQDVALWDHSMIGAAESLLRRASECGNIGRFQLEGALQSAHVHRRKTGQRNWAEIVQLYDALLAQTGSPVVAINRALAVGEARGATAGLESLELIAGDPRISEYQPYWAVRAELLAQTGATHAARQSFEVAIGLEKDSAVRRFLQDRKARLDLQY